MGAGQRRQPRQYSFEAPEISVLSCCEAYSRSGSKDLFSVGHTRGQETVYWGGECGFPGSGVTADTIIHPRYHNRPRWDGVCRTGLPPRRSVFAVVRAQATARAVPDRPHVPIHVHGRGAPGWPGSPSQRRRRAGRGGRRRRPLPDHGFRGGRVVVAPHRRRRGGRSLDPHAGGGSHLHGRRPGAPRRPRGARRGWHGAASGAPGRVASKYLDRFRRDRARHRLRDREGARQLQSHQRRRAEGKHGLPGPEQLRFEEPDRRSDFFSLGVTLYELLSGRRLYPNKTGFDGTRRILTEPPPDIGEVRNDVPPELCELLFEMLAKERDSRPATAAEIASRLEGILAVLIAEEGSVTVSDYMSQHFAEQCQRQRTFLSEHLR